ncbi:MAG: formate acetyltransferase [Desulfatibacillum sp.]|nr:formate acetyltransferase [Desulfatibacillum sp.]
MPLSTTKKQAGPDARKLSLVKEKDRVARLRESVQKAAPGICPERALLWTEYFKDKANRHKHIYVQMAEALAHVQKKRSISIHPGELIVGNYTSRRVGGILFPELHGLVVMQDLLKFRDREVNPLEISAEDQARLLFIVPFWISRMLPVKVYKSWLETFSMILNQLMGHYYVINESAGISHVAPDYETLCRLGTDGIAARAAKLQKENLMDADKWFFYESVKIAAEGLAVFGERYARLARDLAVSEMDRDRALELKAIAKVCSTIPRKGAASFREALQCCYFAQIAINNESLDNSVCPGRMDHYLYPYYEKDVKSGALTRDKAKELVSAFSIKMAEIVPVFNEFITRVHGGLFNGQIVNVGGTHPNGKDSTNELSMIFLEVMDELRMRQPNYTARIHKSSPKKYVDRIYEILSKGANSPSLYNDEVIVPILKKNGVKIGDARNYTPVGCVEPVSQGKSFSSTDAALMNVPIMLELALNQGRRLGRMARVGARTKPVSQMKSMEDVLEAFEIQMHYGMNRLLKDLKAIERANAAHHPTPLTSMLLDGCLDNGVCSTRGGARYNFSGIQCVGLVDVGDSLAAIQQSVFEEKKLNMEDLAALLKDNLADSKWRHYLRGLPKFGNDDPQADAWTAYVLDVFKATLEGKQNTRGGKYTTGIYSVTLHEYWGNVTAALPNGRRMGESLSGGMAPSNGQDRKGPTAVLNSMNRMDFSKADNGINFNIKFDANTVGTPTGCMALQSIFSTYFKRGGMQAQINVLDPAVLMEARDNPEAYPNLLVRISGYSAYFNDLTPQMKEELIRRTSMGL